MNIDVKSLSTTRWRICDWSYGVTTARGRFEIINHSIRFAVGDNGSKNSAARACDVVQYTPRPPVSAIGESFPSGMELEVKFSFCQLK